MKNMKIAVGLGIAGTALLLFSGCTSASDGFADDVAFMKRHTPIVLLKDGDAAVAETPSPAEMPGGSVRVISGKTAQGRTLTSEAIKDTHVSLTAGELYENTTINSSLGAYHCPIVCIVRCW